MHTYKVNTGHEAALEREVARLKGIIDEGKDDRATLVKKLAVMTDKYDRMKGYADQLLDENETMEAQYDEAKTNMALMSDEIATLKEKVSDLEYVEDALSQTNSIKNEMRKREKELKSELEELSKAYNDEHHETQVYKTAWREQREIVALRDDQVAMLERRLAKHAGEKTYPFKEGDIYYVLNQLDGTWIESVWDDESERLHDSTDFPDHPHKVYFTVDQKNVLDKFNPEA